VCANSLAGAHPILGTGDVDLDLPEVIPRCRSTLARLRLYLEAQEPSRVWVDAERAHEPGLRACKLFERELRAEAWASVARSMRQLNIAHIEVDQLFASEAPGEHQVRCNCNGPGR
jgi:hypothetical protein